MSSSPLPSFPGTPSEEIFLNVGHPISALTEDQVNTLGELNFEVVEASNQVADLVDDLYAGYHTQEHPTHFIDILWNRDFDQPKPSGIIIYRTDSVANLVYRVETKGWFIDTRSLPDNFLSIRGYNAVTKHISLADMLTTIRFACYDARHVASAFRACHHLEKFASIKDLQVFAAFGVQEDPEHFATVRRQGSFVAVLRMLLTLGRPVHWDAQRLQNCEIDIRRNGEAKEYMQRPLPDNVVYRFLNGIRYMVDIYRWVWSLRRDGTISTPDWSRAIRQSRDNVQQGFTTAGEHGHVAIFQSAILSNFEYQDDFLEDEDPRGLPAESS